MSMTKIERQAKQLHRQWLSENRSYIEDCSKKPRIYMQSQDFTRIVAWEKLPEHWKKHYLMQARYLLVTQQ